MRRIYEEKEFERTRVRRQIEKRVEKVWVELYYESEFIYRERESKSS